MLTWINFLNCECFYIWKSPVFCFTWWKKWSSATPTKDSSEQKVPKKNSGIAIFGQLVPAGHQNITGFLKTSTCISDL